MQPPFAAKRENPWVSGTVIRAEKTSEQMLSMNKMKCLNAEAMKAQNRRKGCGNTAQCTQGVKTRQVHH